jgi:hypothetical protein
MTRPTRARPVLHIRCFSAVVFAATVFLLACSNSSSSSDGGTGGSTGTGGAGGATPTGTGGGGGDTGAGGSIGGSTGTGGEGSALGTGGQGGATGGAGGHGNPCSSAEPCSTGQICVHLSCGSGVAVCEELPDGGQCPSGWAYTANCATGVGPGCIPPPCTPPPPFCADVPGACSGTPTCNCLPTNLCIQNGGSGGCQFANSTEVMCGSA